MDNTVESILSIALYAQKQAEEYEEMLAAHSHYAQKLAEKYEKMLAGPTQYAQKQVEQYEKMIKQIKGIDKKDTGIENE